ncbi:MAG: beta-phosphoglucomutase, partial [Phycisphaerae bacterium]|nr:beta-phosphoglucomutase [Phycisphaerae bacterium]
MTSPTANNVPAAIFDLDGVLTDTAELHYQSWLVIAGQLGVPFDRQRNEALRGVSRMQSLDLMLGDHVDEFTPEQKIDLAARKNEEYNRLVRQMTPADLFPGARELLTGLRAAGLPTALASSSKNGVIVVDQLQLRPLLDVIVDGNDAPKSKPDPQVFLLAADRLGKTPDRCVVVEDAEAGVEAAQRAGMRVIGIGPASRVGRADMFV